MADDRVPADAARLRSHWWPRPGWRPGRLVHTWHLTFEDAPELHRLVTAHQERLVSLPGLDPVPLRWLHLTVQKIGWVDEVPERAVDAVADAVAGRVGAVPAFDATFGAPLVVAEAIVLPPRPAEPFRAVHDAVRSGIADVLGPDAVPPGSEHGFRPHVSLAYAAGEHDVPPYRAALDATDVEPATVRVSSVTLIRQERVLAPEWVYRWTVRTRAALGGA